MALLVKPYFVHVVGFCEGDHAATPAEVIESCQIVRGVIRNSLSGMPDMSLDSRVMEHKQLLLDKAYEIIEKIITLGGKDALSNPALLAEAVRQGLLHAPQIMKQALIK
jgi:L-lysine 2,3-aminomutase